MQQKVEPGRILELAAGMKRLGQNLGDSTSRQIGEIRSLAREARGDYPESGGVRSAADSIESLLDEIQALSRSVSAKLEEKQETLKWTAEKYRKTEEEAKAKMKSGVASGRRGLNEIFGTLMDAAKKNVAGSSNGTESKFSSFMNTLVGVLLEIQEAALIKNLEPFKEDLKISSLIQILSSGTPEEQAKAREELGQIAYSFHEIARNQISYEVYKAYGNVEYMTEATQIANAQREKLQEFGVYEKYYNPEVDLTGQYQDPIVSALSYNPVKQDHSPMPTERQLQMLIELGLKDESKRDWVKAHYSEIEVSVKQAIEAEKEKRRLEEEAAREAAEWDSMNMFEKSWHSIKEIGTDIYDAAANRNNKKFNSIYDFGNYITFGAFDGVNSFVDGMQDRGDKAFNSTYDFFNWLSMGAVDTVNGAVNPDVALSKEHWMNSFALVTMIFGAKGALAKTEGAAALRPKEIVKTKTPKVIKELEEISGDESTLQPSLTYEELRARVLNNIENSKKARESSNFNEYLIKEKEILENLKKKRRIEGKSEGGSYYKNRSVEVIKKELIEDTSNRAREIYASGVSKKEMGPCLSGIHDPLTGKTFFGQNFKNNATMRQEYQKWIDNDADPIIKDLVKEYELKIASGEIKLSEVADNRLAAHSEIRALDQVLKARREVGLPVDRSTISELFLHNIDLYKSDGMGNIVTKIRCENCRYLTDGINSVGHN